MKTSQPDELINDRCNVWKKARMDQDGNVKDERTQEMIDRIDELRTTQTNKEDDLCVRDDILYQALGSKNPPGKVRGVGKFVTPTKYFNTPRQKNVAKKNESRVVDEEKARMAAYILELEDQLYKRNQSEFSEGNKFKTSGKEESGPSTVPKNDGKEETLKPINKKKKGKTTTEDESKKVGSTCRLAIGSKNNVVVAGTIFEDDGDSENVKVSIDLVVDGECPVPLPLRGKDDILSQEIGSHLLWPRRLLILDKDKDTKCQEDPIVATITAYQSAPVALRCLVSQVQRVRSSIQINAPEIVFGRLLKSSIWLEMLIDFCNMKPI